MTSEPVALLIGRFAAETQTRPLPDAVRATMRRLLLDVAGLCVAARGTDYVAACLASGEGEGRSTAIGHAGGRTALDAALINGTAAHGEDFDDTFEGGPVHAGAPVVPAVLAVAEREEIGGAPVLAAIAVGVEVMCRGGTVAPQAIHKAGFHPTAVLGAMGAAAAVSSLLRLTPEETARALGIAGSMASGIIEYLADGSSTKRLHAGLAAQSGIRAAALAKAGFTGPPTVFEGRHGFYHAFAPSKPPDCTRLTEGLGERWVAADLAFKPYACGTMTQPYVDCAIRLAAMGVAAEEVESMVCEVGEGTVHRLWEPLALKHDPPNGYAAKFSGPDCIAAGFVLGAAGLAAFEDASVREPRRRALARKVRYAIDPDNPYPENYTGHIRAALKDGRVVEIRQPHMRGGAHEPMSDEELERKYRANCAFGGLDAGRTERLLAALDGLASGGALDLKEAGR